MSKAILKKLGVEDVNPGACFGPGKWIEDKDENVHDAIRRCRREIGQIMARAIRATEEPFEPSALPVPPAPETRAIPGMRSLALLDVRPLDFARRTLRLKTD